MGIIRQLPASVINQIAAGEVIERPASVLKELLENAIDAGATRVDVTVERGGKDLVRVADNGKGIGADDLPLAFMPHATSKLQDADDLFKIRTLGFRGEALAAIAEVSKVRCQSRTDGVESASEFLIEAGVSSPITPCAGSQGTVIEVRQLFHNTPVRRTFLKSDNTESGHVLEMFTRIALAHPTVHLTYKSGGKILHDLPASTGMKERIAVFFGQELADSLLWVENELESTHVWGYVAHPSQSRSSNKFQYLFLGGRFVRDRSLSHALTEAYRGLLMVGRVPVAFLNLEIPPDQVDVNVHPTKVEVRFRDSNRLYSQLLAAIRQTFLASDLHSRLQGPAETPASGGPIASPSWPAPAPNAPGGFQLKSEPGTIDRQEVASWFSTRPESPGFRTYPDPGYAGGPSQPSFSSWSNPAPPASPWGRSLEEISVDTRTPFDEFATEPATAVAGEPTSAEPEVVPQPVSSESRPIFDTQRPVLKALQVHDTYLVAETEEGMVVIDQHALHERILYEELKSRLERGGVEAQRLLVPEPVSLSSAEASAVLERKDILARLGLDVEPFGGDTVLVASLPAMLKGIPTDRLIHDLADHFRNKPIEPSADGLLEDVLNMIACKAAVKANQKLSADEVNALLARRHLAANTHHCPHGRPTALIFTKAELERQFGRI